MRALPISVAALLSACVSVPQFSGARVLAPGTMEFGAAGAGVVAPGVVDNAVALPAGGGWIRRGVAERVDVGVRFFGNLVLDAKLQAFDAKWAACSVGAGVGTRELLREALLEFPLSCEAGRADGVRFVMSGKWALGWTPAGGVTNAPGAEVSVAVPLGAWTLRPFVAADFARMVPRVRSVGGPETPVWGLAQGAAGVAIGYR